MTFISASEEGKEREERERERERERGVFHNKIHFIPSFDKYFYTDANYADDLTEAGVKMTEAERLCKEWWNQPARLLTPWLQV